MNADLVPVPNQLLERLAAVGVDVASALQHARLSRSHLAARARLTTRDFFAFWRAVEQAGGARDLGLRLGSEASPHQLDVASLAALHAPNLGEALKKLARYKRLVCPEEIGIEIADGEARIRFHWILAEEQVPLLIVDGAFATVVAIARRGTGRPIAPRRVELTRRRADEATLARHFGCDIHFDAPVDLPGPRRARARRAQRDAQRRFARRDAARPRGRAGRTRARAYADRRGENPARPPDARRAADRRQDRQRDRNEPAHAAASPRGSRNDVSGAARRSGGNPRAVS